MKFNDVLPFAHIPNLMLSRITRHLLLIVCLVSLNATADDRIETISLQLKWQHQFQFAGYYAALEKGFYEEIGLDVKILPHGPNQESPINKVLTGLVEYGVTDTSLVKHRLDGKPVVALAAIFQRSPLTWLVREDSNIRTPHDLVGKRAMYLPGTQSIDLLAMLQVEGIPTDKIQLLHSSFDIQDLIDGNTDAFNAYTTNEPFTLQNHGIAYHSILPRNYGIDFYDDVLFTSESEIKNHPDRVAAFRKASLKGWIYAMENPEEIINLIIKSYSPNKSLSHLQFEAKAMRKLIMPDLITMGHMNPGRWHVIADRFGDLGLATANHNQLEGFLYSPHTKQQDLEYLYKVITASILLAAFFMVLALIFWRLNGRIKKSEQRYHQLVHNMSDGVAVYEAVDNGQDFIFREYNRAGQKIGEVPYDKVIGHRVTEVFPGIKKLGLLEIFQQVWKTGEPVNFPTEKYEDKRITLWVENYIFKLPGGEIVAIFNDITEQKRAEKALRKSEQKLRSSEKTLKAQYKAIPMPTYIWKKQDKDMVLVNYNDAAEKITHGKIVNLLGQSAAEMYKDAPDIQQELKHCLSEKATISRELPYTLITTGEEKYFAVKYAFVPPNLVMVHTDDITEKKFAEKEKERLQRELQQAHKMEALGQLTGGIAHDFNNILGIIMGYTSMTLERYKNELPDKVVEYLNISTTASERARDLIKQMLSFSRSSNGDALPIQVVPLLKENVKMLHSILPSSITVKFDYEEALPNIIMDPTKLQQLLMNLCINAKDAMDGSGTLMINLGMHRQLNTECSACHQQVAGDWLQLSVIDTGSGMTTETQQRLFEPFYTTKDVGKGTGMGMAVLHGIVSSHGGHILVETELSKGTAIHLLFPPVMQPPAPTVDSDPKAETIKGEGKKVLIVDDEPYLANYIGDQLQHHGYLVSVKTSSKDALMLFRKKPEKFSLLITDQTMPDLTGLDLITSIREIRPDIPVIICTGYSENISQQSEHITGTHILSKPVDTEKLLQFTAELLDLT